MTEAFRKKCLNTLTIYEFILVGAALHILFIIPIIYFYKGKTAFKIDFKKFTPIILFYLLLLGITGAIATIIFVTMTKNEDLTILPALSSGTKILAVGISGIIFLNEKLTMQKLFSSLLILSGIIFYFK